MESSSVYMCFPCYQEFPSLEEVLAHQLTCTVEAPANTPAPSSQEQPEEQEVVGVVHQQQAPAPDVASPELWDEGASSLRRPSSSDTPRILYQCGDCELLFDSLNLWQHHRKQGDCQQGAPDSQAAEQAEAHTHSDTQAEPDTQPAPEETPMETEAGPPRDNAGDGQVQSTNQVSGRGDVQPSEAVSAAAAAPVAVAVETPASRRGRGVKRAKPPSVLLCVECGAGFSAIAELVSHRRSQHGLQEALHRCQVCGEGFLNTTLFLYHRKQHPQPHPAHAHTLADASADHAQSHTLLALHQDVQVELLEEAVSHQQGLLLLAAAGEGQSLGLVTALATPPDKPDDLHVAMETEATPTEVEAEATDAQASPTDTEVILTENQVSMFENEATPTIESSANELVAEVESQGEGADLDPKKPKESEPQEVCESASESVCESVCESASESVCVSVGAFLCRVCGSSFPSEGALQKHREERHGQKEALHTCAECGETFMNTTLFLYHRKQHRAHSQTPTTHSSSQYTVEDSGDASCGDITMELPDGSAAVPLVSFAMATAGSTPTVLDPALSEPIPPPPVQLSRDWSRAALPHRCPHCGRLFTRRALLRAHVSSHTGQKLFRCHVCAKAFSSPANLLRHSQTHAHTGAHTHGHSHAHTHLRPHHCHICGKDFSQPATLKRHMLIHTRPGVRRRRPVIHTVRLAEDNEDGAHLHTCPDCPASFKMNTQLQKHRLLHTSHPFSCEICGEAFQRRKDLDLHSLSHQEPQSCPHCSAQFLSQTVLQVHLQRCQGNQAEAVPEGDGGTVSVSTGTRGRGRGQGRGKAGGQLECEMCGHRCVTQEGLELHRLSHTGQTPLRCPLTPCRRRFATGAALGEHVLAHCQGLQHKQRAPSRYRCQHCAKEFAYASTFAVHMRIHTDERPFECSICGKRFRQLPHLQDHERIHSGLRPFACWVCGKSFSVAARLTEHARVHSGEKPYVCPRCPAAFRSRANLDKHLHIHANDPHADHAHSAGAEGESAVQTILLVHQVAPEPPHADAVADDDTDPLEVQVPEGAGTALILPAEQASSSGLLVPGSPSSSVVILHPTITVPSATVPNISVVEGQDVPHTIEFIIEETV